MLHDGLAHGPGCAHCGFEVHQQAGAGVHFHNGAALFVQRAGDVLRHHVDAGDVQPHHLGGQRGDVGHFGVHVVGAIHGHVAVALHHHLAACGGHGVGAQVLPLEFELHFGVGCQVDDFERVLFFVAPARVGVELAVDQLLDGGPAIAGDADHFTARRRHQLAAHHQQAVLVAGDEAFDHHVAAFGVSHMVGRLDVFLLAQVQRDATAMVAVRGFDHHGQADVLGGFPGLFRAVNHLAVRDRHAAGFEQTFGEVLVAGNAFGDGAGEFALGRPDAALAGPVAQLHQVAVVEADVGNAAVGAGRHDAGGAGAQVAVIDLGAQPRHGSLHVKRVIVDGGHQQAVPLRQRNAGHLLVPRPENHAVHATHRRAAGLAEARGHARQVEQFDDNMFQHMAAPGALLQALQETAALAHAAVVLLQRRQPGCEAVIQPRNGVGGMVFQNAQVQPDLQCRPVSPDVGAAQVVDAQKLDIVDFCHVSERFRRHRTGRTGSAIVRPVGRPFCQSMGGGSAVCTGVSGFGQNSGSCNTCGFEPPAAENPNICNITIL